MSEELENIEFDKHIRERYADHGVLPSDKLWANINSNAAQLETSTIKNRLTFYRWLTVGLIMLLAGTTIYYQFTTNKRIAQLQEKGTNTSIIQKAKKNIIENTIIESSTSTANIEKSNLSTFSNKNNQPINSEDKNPTLIIASTNKEDEATLASIKNNKSSIIKNANKIIEHPNTEYLTPTKRQKKDYSLNDKIEVTDKPTINGSTNQQIKQSEINKEPVLAESLDDLSHITKIKEENKRNVPNTRLNNIENVVVDLPQQVPPQQPLSQSDTSIANSQEKANTIATPPPIIPEKTLSRITVSALFLPTYSSRSLKSDANSSDFYNTNQRVKTQFNSGLNVGYNILDKWIVRIGANYSKLNNTYDLNNVRPKELPILMDPANKSITIYSSLGTVVAENLSSFKFAGENEDDYELNDEGDFTSLSYKEEQKFTFLHLPVTIGYEFGKGKLKLIVDAGVVASITISSNSKIEITNVNKPEELIKLENYHKTKSFNIGGTIGLGAKYDLTKRLSLVLAPIYNHSFTNINKDNSSTIKPYSINLSTGLQYRF